MTVPATPSQTSYAGDGVSLAFTIPFIFDTSADLKVIKTSSSGVPAVLSTGFSITGGAGSTGTCTMSVAPAVGETLTILDNPALTQDADYTSNDAFPAETHEAALDRTVRQVKRLHQRVNRSIRVDDGDLSDGDDLITPVSSARAGLYLAFDATGNPIAASGTGGGDAALRTDLAKTVAGTDGARLSGYRLDGASAVAQSLYSKLSRYIDAADFGFLPSASAATNAAAITAAIAFAQLSDATYGGGTVVLPAGVYNCNPFSIPQYCYVRGRGYSTRLVFASSGFNINIGGTTKTGLSKYKCGFSDASILLTHKDGHAARMMETFGAEFSRCYVEGTLTAARSNRVLRIDGGDVSAFFNSVTDIIGNHVELGYEEMTSGIEGTTRNQFVNCTSFGDVGSFPNSQGVTVAALCGSGTQWLGGNFESCGKGVVALNGCQMFSVVGACFEGNTTDVEAQPTASTCTFVGCNVDNPGKVINTTFRALFIGCGNGSNLPAQSQFAGVHVFNGLTAGDNVVTVVGTALDTTTQTFRLMNTAGNTLFALTNQGKFARVNNAGPVAVNAACVDLATAIALLNQIRAMLIADGLAV